MQTRFFINCHIKTPSGPETYGRFEIGNNREFAYQLFSKLKGAKEVNEHHMLCLELMETVNGLPVNITVLGCTLNELAENCRTISKEIFSQFNLNLSIK